MDTISPDQRQAPHAPLPVWHRYLAAARTEEEIITLTRDFVATWSPNEISRLPLDCRPGRIRDADDLSRWAFELTNEHCTNRASDEDEALLVKMMSFVAEAATRMAEVKAAFRLETEAG